MSVVSKKRSTAGFYRTERDLSTVASPVGTSTGATVVRSRKGRVNYIYNFTTDKEMIDALGEPVFTSGTSVSDTNTPEMGYGMYAGLTFLQESNALLAVRDFDTGDKYATVVFDADGSTSATETGGVQASADTVPDKIDDIYTLEESLPSGKALLVGFVGPGVDGNNYAVTIETFHADCDWFNSYDDYTSATDVSAHPIESKVFKIQVFEKNVDEDWDSLSFSSISASPIETFYGTRTSQQDANKQQLRISEVVNGNSDYIYVVPGSVDFEQGGAYAATPSDAIPLVGGAVNYGTNITSTGGWSFFESREDSSPTILICPTYNMAVKQEVARIAAKRKDCIAVCQSGQRSDVTVATVKTAETYGYVDPTYVALYAGWSRFYDKYNDRLVYIPDAIHGAALMARTDANGNVWDAPAGINNGIISNTGKNVRFTFEQVGQLSDVSINTTRYIQGIGDVMWMQRTAQQKQSSLRDINIRRTLIFIEGTIEQLMLDFLFTSNTPSTRRRVYNVIDSFLSSLNGAFDTTDGDRGYAVVCDATNNTPLARDNNKLIVDHYLKFAKKIYFIEGTFNIVSSGISFSEVIGA